MSSPPLCRFPHPPRRAREPARIVPSDTENRTFLHDIPFIRAGEQEDRLAERIATLLGGRKGIIVEGVGIVAVGAITVEQAYINYSSVFHSTFVKYLQDILADGFLLPGEQEAFSHVPSRLAPPPHRRRARLPLRLTG